MRIDWLDFDWVGYWRQRRLALSPGLTLVLGDNEAGKSTALRAIDALFGGVTAELAAPRRESEFALGAGLRHGGEVLEIWRRGRRLLGPSGQDVDPRFQQWVHPAWVRQFRELFRLSHDELRQGDADILKRDGAIGRLLLEMQAGRSALGAAAASLDEQVAQVFKKSPLARTALRGRIEALKGARDAVAKVARSDDWNRAVAEKDESDRLFLAAQEQLGTVQARHAWWGQVRIHWGELQAWRAHDQALHALLAEGEVPGPEWAAQVRAALAELDAKVNAREQQREQGAALQRRLEDLAPPSPLLGVSALVKSLQQRRTQLAGGTAALTAQREDGARALNEVSQSLEAMGQPRDLGRDAAAMLVVPVPRRAPIQDALDELLSARRQLHQAQGALEDARQRKDSAQAHLGTLPSAGDPAELDTIAQIEADRTRAADDASTAARQRDHEAASLARLLAQLGFAPRAPSDSLHLPRPARATADAHAARLTEADRHQARQQAAVDEAQRQDRALQARLAALADGADDGVLTARQLQRARHERDRAFGHLRALWSPLADDAPARLEALSTLYETLVTGADLLADRAIEQARRSEERRLVAEEASRHARSVEEGLLALRSSQAEARSAREAYRALFDAAVLQPPEPAALASWYERVDGAEAGADRWASAQQAFVEADNLRAALVQQRQAAIAACGLDRLAAFGLDTLAALKAEQRRREQAASDRRQAQEVLDRATTLERDRQDAYDQAVVAERHARERWDEAATGLPPGLPRDLPTAAAWLREQDRLAGALQRLSNAESTIQAHERGQQQLRIETLALLDSLTDRWPAAEALRHDPQAAIDSLEAERERASGVEHDRAALLGQWHEAQAREAVEARAVDVALQALAALTGTEPADPAARAALDRQLDRAEACARRRAEMQALVTSIRRALGREPRALLDDELAGLADGDLPQQEDWAVRALAEQQQRRDQCLQARTQAQERLETLRMTDATVVAQQGVQAADALAQELEDLVPMLVAQHILAKAQELAQKGASPFLQEAGAYLSELTQGVWTGLHVNEQGESPVLVAESQHDGHRRISELSDGTRDPLRFALRLAAVVRAHRACPMPLVLDDFLVHFDDQRTAAALRLLARVAQQESLQIIVFTHHDQVLHLAAQHIPRQYTHHVLALPGRERLPVAAAQPVIERPLAPAIPSDETDADAGSDAAVATAPDHEVDALVLQVLEGAVDWMAKSRIQETLAAGGVSLIDAQWQNAIRRLEQAGRVQSIGQRKGKKYALPGRYGALEGAPVAAEE